MLDSAAPLAGRVLPAEFAEPRRQMEAQMGRRDGEYVQVLRLLKTYLLEEVHVEVRKALA